MSGRLKPEPGWLEREWAARQEDGRPKHIINLDNDPHFTLNGLCPWPTVPEARHPPQDILDAEFGRAYARGHVEALKKDIEAHARLNRPPVVRTLPESGDAAEPTPTDPSNNGRPDTF